MFMGNLSNRRTYDKEFKTEAVRLVLGEGYRDAGVERDLGVGSLHPR
jgi:transposase-like protein